MIKQTCYVNNVQSLEGVYGGTYHQICFAFSHWRLTPSEEIWRLKKKKKILFSSGDSFWAFPPSSNHSFVLPRKLCLEGSCDFQSGYYSWHERPRPARTMVVLEIFFRNRPWLLFIFCSCCFTLICNLKSTLQRVHRMPAGYWFKDFAFFL